MTSTDPTVKESSSHLRYQLRQARISIYQGQEDTTSKTELKRIIEQIRTIEFKSQKQTSEPVNVVKPSPTVEPNETSPDARMQAEPEKTPTLSEPNKSVKPQLPYEPISDQTLQMLENFLQHPNQYNNPFELGEILFLSGRLKEAAVFYQEALNRSNQDKTSQIQDRAWILFQIGNCLQSDDLTAAKNTYRQLIAEYPDSLWTKAAKAQEELIDWYLNDKPLALIAECKQLGEPSKTY